MCPICVQFIVWHHRWVDPIDVVHVVIAMLLYVDTCVQILPHILACNNQLCVYGNTTLV